MYQVFKCSPSLYNLQRCVFPSDIPPDHYGKFAFLNTSSNNKYFVKICVQPFLPKNTCVLDGIVQCKTKQDLPAKETLLYNDLKLVSSIKPIKTIQVDLVFKSIWNQKEWADKSVAFKEILKHFLELFVLAPSVTICVNAIKEIGKLGIQLIVIKSVGNIPAGKVVESSKLEIRNLTCYDRFLLDEAVPLPLYGLNSQCSELKGLLSTFQKCHNLDSDSPRTSLKVLVLGTDGSGKKSLVKTVALECGAVLISIDGPELSRPEPGETERLLKKKFDEACLHSKEGLTILFLLRLESMCGKDGRISSQLLHLLDSTPSGLAVIATTSKPHLLHQSFTLSSRFHHRIFLSIPTEAERSEMIAGLSGGFLTEAAASKLAQKTPGFVAADLKLLLARAKRQAHYETSPCVDKLHAALEKCLYEIEGSSVRGELGLVRGDKLDLQELGGLVTVKNVLLQSVVWPLVHPDSFKRFNIPRPSGVLLYGPPGCAKTSLARAIAGSSCLTFLSVSVADLLSPYVGDAELALTSLFQRARDASPTLLFVDEIDALVGNREEKHRGAQERLLSTFLVEMDGIGVHAESASRQVLEARVTVIGATNRPDCIDPALLRPGRLDRLLYVPPPTQADRLEILKLLTKLIPLGDCVDLNFIAEHTDLYSGADLKHLCREAGLHALNLDGMDTTAVRQEHFLAALDDTPPSLSPCQIDFYRNFSFS